MELMEEFAECLESLEKTMDEAGGKPLTVSDLKSMSAIELIMRIAPNKIRFQYDANLNAWEQPPKGVKT